MSYSQGQARDWAELSSSEGARKVFCKKASIVLGCSSEKRFRTTCMVIAVYRGPKHRIPENCPLHFYLAALVMIASLSLR